MAEKKIKREWLNFVNNQKVDISVISPVIYESWKRSKKFGVDPYLPLEKIIPSEQELKNLTRYEDLLPKYGEIINVIAEIAEKTGLICRIANQNAEVLKVIANTDIVKTNFKKGNYFATNASENFLGTNALCLSIKINKPVQVLGPEHYYHFFHGINCSAAPIHNEKGEVIGCVNISTNNIKKVSMQTMGLVISIAQVLDNHLFINKMLEEQILKNIMLKEITEHMPSGMVYLNNKNQIENYNEKILKLFEIKEGNDEGSVKNMLLRYFHKMGFLESSEEICNKEFLLKRKGKIDSFVVTKRNIFISGIKQQKGSIILVQKTDSVLKLHGTLWANNTHYTFDSIIGNNSNLNYVKQLSQKVAKSSSAVIIYGESGTGKELFAQAIHNASSRHNKPFVAINCGAIPSELIESEIFGYESGAFTGALKGGKPGKLEIASGGTFFLDEIESMPLNLQIKLLRALSINRISKIGGSTEIPIDVRIISATKKDLLKEVEEGNFREDLFYRLNIVTIKLPPLRERKDDIPILADYFIDFFSDLDNIGVSDSFYKSLLLYDWRGNIRELRNVIERAILFLGNEKKLTHEYLPEQIRNNYLLNKIDKDFKKQSRLYKNTDRKKSLLEIAEELVIKTVLQEEKYNLSKTAKKLNISRSTLYSKIKDNEITLDTKRK